MRLFGTFAAVAILVIGVFDRAGAVTLRNDDDRRHTVFVQKGGNTKERVFVIKSDEVIENLCNACLVEVENRGSLSARDDDMVLINPKGLRLEGSRERTRRKDSRESPSFLHRFLGKNPPSSSPKRAPN